MRWKTSRDGDIRRVERFLWWPTTFDGETRWLERAVIVQRFYPLTKLETILRELQAL